MTYVDLAINYRLDMLIELQPELYSGALGWARAESQGSPGRGGRGGFLPSSSSEGQDRAGGTPGARNAQCKAKETIRTARLHRKRPARN